MATRSSILARKIQGTEDPGRLQAMGSQRVRLDWARVSMRVYWKREWVTGRKVGRCDNGEGAANEDHGINPITAMVNWRFMPVQRRKLWVKHTIFLSPVMGGGLLLGSVNSQATSSLSHRYLIRAGFSGWSKPLGREPQGVLSESHHSRKDGVAGTPPQKGPQLSCQVVCPFWIVQTLILWHGLHVADHPIHPLFGWLQDEACRIGSSWRRVDLLIIPYSSGRALATIFKILPSHI